MKKLRSSYFSLIVFSQFGCTPLLKTSRLHFALFNFVAEENVGHRSLLEALSLFFSKSLNQVSSAALPPCLVKAGVIASRKQLLCLINLLSSSHTYPLPLHPCLAFSSTLPIPPVFIPCVYNGGLLVRIVNKIYVELMTVVRSKWTFFDVIPDL